MAQLAHIPFPYYFTILNSEFLNPNSEICTTNFRIRKLWVRHDSGTHKRSTPHTCIECMDDWLAILHPFNSISVILGRWVGDNKRLYAVEPRLRFKRLPLPTPLQHGTARSSGQRFIYWGTGAPMCTVFVFKVKELLKRSLKGVPFGANTCRCVRQTLNV